MGTCFPAPAERRAISGPAQRLEIRTHNVLSSGILSIYNGFLEFREEDGRSLRWETHNLKEFSCDRSFFLFTASQLCQYPGSYVFRTPRARNYFRSINTAIASAAQPQNVSGTAPPRAAYDPLSQAERERGHALAAAAAAAAAAETKNNTPGTDLGAFGLSGAGPSAAATGSAGGAGVGPGLAAPGQQLHSLSNLAPIEPSRPPAESPTHATPVSAGSDGSDEVGGSDPMRDGNPSQSYQDRAERFAVFQQQDQPTGPQQRGNYNKLKDIKKNGEQPGSAHGSASPSRPSPLDAAVRDSNNGSTMNGAGLSPPNHRDTSLAAAAAAAAALHPRPFTQANTTTTIVV